jgi:Transglutaminase-like superfamily
MTLTPVSIAGTTGRLPAWRKLALAGEILSLYGRARPPLKRNDLRGAVSRIRDGHRTETDGVDRVTYIAGLRYGRAVGRVLGALPLDSRCLMQSLVLTGLLARRGVRGDVVIGVRQGEEFGAHAWVELGGYPVLPPHGEEFERLLTI